ncbi:MAG TPA: alpha/beta hydrolase, partial [Dongiaceae bacterium]|nr:alpha/beta hydrolase [Dongiaceae bacterium]
AGIGAEDRMLSLPGRQIAIRIYRPERAAGPLPVILYYHGGSWIFGGLDSHDLPTARLAAITGAAIVSVDYRLAPEHKYPAALDDAWDSLAWVIDAAPQLGFDPQRIVVAGDSAGGALAAGVALRARDRGGPALRGQGLIYPCLRPTRVDGAVFSPGLDETALASAFKAYFATPRDSQDPYAMPLLAKSFANLPPAIICAAECDVLLADACAYAAALDQAGTASHLIIAKGLPHTFLRALHMCGAASRAFEDFGRELAALLRN